MDSDEKRKEHDSDSNEDPSSDDGVEDDWREELHLSIRVKNRTLIAEALYENPYVQISVAKSLAKATSAELRIYLEAKCEHEYLTMVGDYQRMVGAQEISEELETILPQLDRNYGRNVLVPKKNLSPSWKQIKGIPAYPVGDVLQKQPIAVMSRQHAECQHVFTAGMVLVESLDYLAEELESLPNDLSGPAEILEVYEAVIQELVETLSKHIKTICDCPQGVTTDFDHGSAPVDLISQTRHSDNSEMVKSVFQQCCQIRLKFPDPIQQPSLQLEKQPLAEHRSDDNGNTTLPPQQQPQLQQKQQRQQEQSGSNENQTEASLDVDFLAESMVSLST